MFNIILTESRQKSSVSFETKEHKDINHADRYRLCNTTDICSFVLMPEYDIKEKNSAKLCVLCGELCIFAINTDQYMNSLIFPPYVHEGDRVIILSPSSKIDKSFLKGAKKRLKSWGLEVVTAKHAGSAHGTYAGSIQQRLKDLQEAMDDEKAKIILVAAADTALCI